MKKWGREGGEKGGEGKEPSENLGEKLRRIAGKRGGQSTPVLPFQAHFSSCGGAQDSTLPELELEVEENNPKNPALSLTASLPPGASARTIAATVWELHQYNLPITKMHNGGGGGGRRNHRHHHHHHRHHLLEDNPDPSPASPELGSASSLRRHVAASLMQHHRTIQRNHNERNAIRAVSPASYGSSSMEVAPYNPAVTPTSSIEFKGGNGETNYSLKTSTELLKVLNRIWSLEEQHTANVTLVRALKRELDLARSKIKELSRDRQSDRHEMEHLLKQITEDKQGHAIQSVKDELEDERKLRKRSETLHRKLARELYESKTTLMNALRELENERRSRVLLEDLCDEFAWGIKTYEQEIHSLKVININPDKSNGSNHRAMVRDGLILHISESWLDERLQTKQETTPLKNSVAEKLSSEIEAFLEAKRKGLQKLGSGSGPTARRRHSLESIPMNLAASAPPDDVSSGGGGGGGDSPCFELDKPVARSKDEIANGKKKLASQGTGKGRDSSSLQVKFEEQMAQAILGQMKTEKEEEEDQVEITEEEVGLNSKYLDSLLKNHYLQTGNDFDDSVSKPVWKSHPSPVRGWTTRLPIEDLEISESSTKVPIEPKDQTSLKSKLLEARTRGHRSGSRVKTKN